MLFLIIIILSVVVLSLSVILISFNRGGNIEIKIVKVIKPDPSKSLIYVFLFLDITYLSKTKKEQTAILINDVVEEEFGSIADINIIKNTNNSDFFSKIVKSITEKIEAKMECKIIDTRYKVTVTNVNGCPKEVFP